MRGRASVQQAYQAMKIKWFDNNNRQNDSLVLSRNDLNETLNRKFGLSLLTLLQKGARLPVPYELLQSEELLHSEQLLYHPEQLLYRSEVLLLPVLLGSDQSAFVVEPPVPSLASASASASVSSSAARNSSNRQQQPSSSKGVSISIAIAADSSSNMPQHANLSSSSKQPVASIRAVTAPKPALRNGPTATANNAANSQRQVGSSSQSQAAQQLQLSAVATNDAELVGLVYQVMYECVCLRCWAFEGNSAV